MPLRHGFRFVFLFLAGALVCLPDFHAQATQQVSSHLAPATPVPAPSPQYRAVQQRLARGWNTWDVHSVTTQVLLPSGLAIHVDLLHNTTEGGDAFLRNPLIGRLEPGAEKVTPGPHAWDGSFTSLRIDWKGHSFAVESAHDGPDLVLLVSPLPSHPAGALPPTVVFSVNFLWNRPGTAVVQGKVIQTRGGAGTMSIYCTCATERDAQQLTVPIPGPYFAADLVSPVGLSTGRPRALGEIQRILLRQQKALHNSLADPPQSSQILDAIRTALGWDTIYEPEKQRVFSPVSRLWSVSWGGYVLFDWDTFFAATMASTGDRDLAYADALETLREETPEGFVPNYARAGGWKSSDRSEPPVGAITVLGLYRRYHDRWFLGDAFQPLLSWNRWWDQHRSLQGYIVLGSDPANPPVNLDDSSRGTWQGAVFESGLDNSPMYDGTTYNPQTHLLEFADVGMTSLYVADCDALAQMATLLEKPVEARELRDRAARYRAALASLWSPQLGIFLNKDLHTGHLSTRLSPTNFYPLLARAATPAQARIMIQKHLRNPAEFWGRWVIPSIARNDPAFHDQNYWRGRIWGPMNYLVYLGLRNYDEPAVRRDFAQKSAALFLQGWQSKGHVHENYNAITGSGDDVASSDRFYHWGALLGYVEVLEQSSPAQ
ncbi:MAG TPA: trehalase family glycosidase [Terracidiphilus sp.]|nr:trehalase family glycosidase [Terracidiphilus sp.]